MRASSRPMVHARLLAALGIAALGMAASGLVVPSGPAWAGNLSCQTVNGHTICLHGAGSMRCTTVGNRTDCYLDAGPDAGPANPPGPVPPRPVRPPMPSIPDMLSPDGATGGALGGGVHVERGPGGLRVRVDGMEVSIP